MEVVALGPDDWRRWRALRLAALSEAPAAFRSTLAQWSGTGDTEERWRSRLTGVPHTLVVVADGRDVGMVALAAPDGDEPPELVSMWVAPGARGTGADNVAAVRLYLRHGFVDVGVSPDDERERRMRRAPG